jgi:AraC family L-rhamnose operon transcriptional activator RhaR
MLRDLPHAPGYTLAADAYIGPDEPIGFSVAQHKINVFMHYHDFYELALVVQGKGMHITAEGSQPVSRGSVVFVAPGAGHGFEKCESLVVYNCFLRIEAAQFDLPWAPRDGRLGRLFGPPGLKPQRPIVVTLDEADLVACLAHLDAIRERAIADRSEAHDLGHLLLALDILARDLEQEQPDSPAVDPRAPVLVMRAVELIERDLGSHWTLDDLSAELCVGPFHLVRLFKRWTGLPPMAFANRRRAERAAALLSTTDDPIAEVGAAVGWPDPSHFARRFRREFGAAPRVYRDRAREHHAAGHDHLVAQPSAMRSGSAIRGRSTTIV